MKKNKRNNVSEKDSYIEMSTLKTEKDVFKYIDLYELSGSDYEEVHSHSSTGSMIIKKDIQTDAETDIDTDTTYSCASDNKLDESGSNSRTWVSKVNKKKERTRRIENNPFHQRLIY